MSDWNRNQNRRPGPPPRRPARPGPNRGPRPGPGGPYRDEGSARSYAVPRPGPNRRPDPNRRPGPDRGNWDRERPERDLPWRDDPINADDEMYGPGPQRMSSPENDYGNAEHRIDYRSNNLNQPDFYGRGPDEDIRGDIYELLANNRSIFAEEVNVLVRDGLVRLEGYVRTERERDLATRLARMVPGVRGIDNRLQTYA